MKKEIAGYRDVLDMVYESHDYIPVSGNIILQFHRNLMRYSDSNIGGTYKITQNYIKEKRPDDTEYTSVIQPSLKL